MFAPLLKSGYTSEPIALSSQPAGLSSTPPAPFVQPRVPGNINNSLKELLIRFGVEVYSFSPSNLETTDSLYFETVYNHYLEKIASFCK